MSVVWIALVLLGSTSATNHVIPPQSPTGEAVIGTLAGRSDVPWEAYLPLGKGLQSSLSTVGYALWLVITADLSTVGPTVDQLKRAHNASNVVVLGHSMSSGAIDAQNYVHQAAEGEVQALVLVAGFLDRRFRPSIVQCLAKAAVQPKTTLKHPLGYLEDGAHDCHGDNKVHYTTPTLTVGGTLDGVVRVTRLAEAYYTQTILTAPTTPLPVVVVPGINHAILLNLTAPPPPNITHQDLPANITAGAAIQSVSEIITQFLHTTLKKTDEGGRVGTYHADVTKDFMEPLLDAFVEQEGNWFFTGGDDEHGESKWAAEAQQRMVDPLPGTYQWKVTNGFHLLQDDPTLPPYYRHRHRAHVAPFPDSPHTINSSTVAQLRFIELTPAEVDEGFNGDAVIKEEKLNILTAVPDDGSIPTSAIEIATKLASRQKGWNVTNHTSPATLDDGNRCAAINTAAYEWALSRASPSARQWFTDHGTPLVMGPDRKPYPPGGPWFIWNYLNYTRAATHVTVSSWYVFYALGTNPYGAGTHYCKLLSPARALEWIYVDGLRQ